jgi:hypothetical protein
MDGKTDVLWHHTSVQRVIWLMNGTALLSVGTVGAVSTNWQIKGV